METKMINRNIAQIIITFAFFYSTLVCHFKAIQLLEEGQTALAVFLWVCCLSSFLGAIRFQIARFVIFLRKNIKK